MRFITLSSGFKGALRKRQWFSCFPPVMQIRPSGIWMKKYVCWFYHKFWKRGKYIIYNCVPFGGIAFNNVAYPRLYFAKSQIRRTIAKQNSGIPKGKARIYASCLRSTVAQGGLPKFGKISSRRREDPEFANKTVADNRFINDMNLNTFQGMFADFIPRPILFMTKIWILIIIDHIHCRRHFAGRMSLMLKSLSP